MVYILACWCPQMTYPHTASMPMGVVISCARPSVRPTVHELGFWYCRQIAWKKWSTFWHADVHRWLTPIRHQCRWVLSFHALVRPSVQLFMNLGFGIADKSLGRNGLHFSMLMYPDGLPSVIRRLWVSLSICSFVRPFGFGFGLDWGITVVITGRYGDICCHSWQHILVLWLIDLYLQDQMWVGVGGFSEVVATYNHVGGSFNLIMVTAGDVWIIPSFWILDYVLHVEHISCGITNCGQHQWFIPSLSIYIGLTGRKHSRKLLSLALDLFCKILFFQVAFLIFVSIAIFSHYFFLVGLLLQSVTLFQSRELVKSLIWFVNWCRVSVSNAKSI